MNEYLKTDIFWLVISLFIIVPLWNAFQINEKNNLNNKKKYWSRLWHTFGVIIRGVLCVLLIRLNDGLSWQLFSILAVFCYPIWNWMLNYGMQIPPPQILWYTGNTSIVDRINKRITYSIYAALFINLLLSIFF